MALADPSLPNKAAKSKNMLLREQSRTFTPWRKRKSPDSEFVYLTPLSKDAKQPPILNPP